MKNIRLMQRLLIIMGLVIIILGLGTCYGVMKERAARSEISDLQSELIDTKQRFIEKIKQDSSREYRQNQLLSSERNARILAEDKAKGFKRIQSVVRTTAEIKHDTIFIPYTSESLDTIEWPRSAIVGHKDFEYKTKYDTIVGRVDSLGVTITKNVTNLGELTTIVGYEKQGLFKKSKPVVLVTTENPSVRITGMSNVVVKQPKPKRLAWLISGIAVGITGGILLMAN